MPRIIVILLICSSFVVGHVFSSVLFQEISVGAGVGYEVDDPYSIMTTAVADFNGDGLLDIFVQPHTYPWRNGMAFYINQGDMTFSKHLAGEDSMWDVAPSDDYHQGVWADYDNDGDPDYMNGTGGEVGNMMPRRRYLHEMVGGRMISRSEGLGIGPSVGSGRSIIWADLDGDSRLDYIFTTDPIALQHAISRGEEDLESYRAPSLVFQQQSDYSFEEITESSGIRLEGFATTGYVTDLWGDGHLDLVVIDGAGNDTDLLVDEDGNGESSDDGNFFAGVYELGSTLPLDRRSELPAGAAYRSMRDLVVEDFDGDLVVDMIAMGCRPLYWDWGEDETDLTPFYRDNYMVTPVHLRYDAITGEYLDVADSTGLGEREAAWGVIAEDFDNDMDVDLFVARQLGEIAFQPVFFENQGDGTFVRDASGAGAMLQIVGRADTFKHSYVGPCLSAGDFDNNGCIDIYCGVLVQTNELIDPLSDFESVGVLPALFKNVGNGNHWIAIELTGMPPFSNRDAIGAKVYVSAGGKVQLRIQDGRVRRSGQDSKRLHFGLAEFTTVDWVEVHWPSGIVNRVEFVEADQILKMVEFLPAEERTSELIEAAQATPGWIVEEDASASGYSKIFLDGAVPELSVEPVVYDLQTSKTGRFTLWGRIQSLDENAVRIEMDADGQRLDRSCELPSPHTWFWCKIGYLWLDSASTDLKLFTLSSNCEIDGFFMTNDALQVPIGRDGAGAEQFQLSYTSWTEFFSWELLAQRDPWLDPDGDGLPNYLEYQLGEHPLISNHPISSGFDADALTLDFPLYPFADFRAGLSVEVSSDLKSWNVSDDVILNLYEESANAWQHRLYFPKSSKSNQFGRLRFSAVD